MELVNYRRLLVVALNPEQEYTSIEAIKEELAETVKNLAPAYMDGQYVNNSIIQIYLNISKFI